VAAFAQNTAPSATAASEEESVIELSPFEVSDDQRSGYMATSSLAGSRLNTKLRDLAAPIAVVTAQFLEDTASTNVTDILVYTTNTEVAGVYGNFLGTSSGDVGGLNEILRAPHRGTRVRGLNNADLTRDFFVTDIPLDSYNINGVDISRGPNSILYGLGSPAGVINYSLKTPNLQENRYGVDLRVGSYGSARQNVDIDHVLVRDTLGIRLMALNDHARFDQEYKYDHAKRGFASVRWTPKLAERVFTQFTFNYEKGETDANRPSLTPPEDFVSPWFTVLNKWTKANVHDNNGPAGLTRFTTGSPNNNWWDSLALVYSDPSSNATGGSSVPDAIRNRGGNPWGGWVGVANPMWNVGGNHPLAQKSAFADDPRLMAVIEDFEQVTGRAFTGFGGWKDKLILDRGVFDYRNHSLAGPNSTQYNDYDALNLSVVQTYLGGNAGIEVSYDAQNYEDGYSNLIGGSNRVTVDINQFLRSGAPNPNLGRPLVVDATDGNIRVTDRESVRATVYYKLNFEDVFEQRPTLARILGSHTFTGVAAEQKYSLFGRSFNLYGWDSSYTRLDNDDRVFGIHYLGDSLASATDFSQVRFGGVTVDRRPPTSVRAMVQGNSNVSPPIANWDVVQVGTYFDPERLHTGASATRSTTSNKSFIWQSRFFADTVVGLFGYREDDFEKWTKPSAPRNAAGKTLPFDPAWTYEGTTPIRASAATRSYGVMVHMPRFIRDRMPAGTSLSFGYNQSSNFDPSSVSVDIYGEQNPQSSGESKDYTVLITALRDRVSLRATKYETVQKNTTWRGSAPGIWDVKGRLARAMNGLMTETWIDGRLTATPTGVTGRQNTTPEFIVNRWFFGDTYDQAIAAQPLPEGWTVQSNPELLTQPLRVRASAAGTPEGSVDANGALLNQPPISVAEADYRAAWFAARTDAQWYRPFGQALFEGLQFRRDPNRKWGFWDENTPPNYANTSDIESTGYEFELTVNPKDNWRITANASRQEAVASNIMQTLGRFFAENREFFRDGYDSEDNGVPVNYWNRDGFADIDFWGNANTQTMGEITSVAERSYLIGAASEGRPVNELRKWSFNLVSSYDFTAGRLAGLGVGGAVRWQDKAKIGYLPKYLPSLNQWIDDLDAPYFAPAETNVDFWVSYRRKLRDDRIDWSVQLNVRNAFASDVLIHTGANPDGSISQARIAGATTASLTTRFGF
jgi:outer membrane receptor protein involved in Fe transport